MTVEAPEQPFLLIEGVEKRFGATIALDGVKLAARSGEIHALVGENGSGKSTLMRIVAGAIQPDAGSITLDGRPYRPRSPIDARRAGIAMIHQELSICNHLSVAENIVLGVEDAKAGVLNRSTIRQRAREALAALGHGDLDPDVPAGSLSLALRQIIEIARCVAEDSRLVILDEPTSSLAESDVRHLFEVVRKVKKKGSAVLYISHFLNEIHDLADRLTVLRDGVTVGEREVAGITDEEIIRLMVGRSIEEMYPRSSRTPGEPIFVVKGLTGAEKPVDVDLALCKGEVVGIAGLNGSGRSELLRVIFGLDPVRRGEVRIGVFSGNGTPARRWDQGVGFLSENRKEEGLLLNLSIAENITMASLHSLWVSPVAQDRAGHKWIIDLTVKCRGPEQAVGELSGGNQQKVALARMLHHNVDLLLLDEPTRGIDVGSKEQIYRLIDQLATSGKTVLMVSSYLPELLGTCDRIAVMSRGRLSDPVPAESATQESLMELAVGQ